MFQNTLKKKERNMILLDTGEAKQLEALMTREKSFQLGIARIHIINEASISSY